MPGPSSLTPRPVSPSLPKKRFKLAQANKSLPLVKRIVTDIVRTHDRAVELQALIETQEETKEQATTQKTLDSAMDRLQDYVGELAEVGCELKDYQTGLIDFIGRHQGRDVYLCWKLGEEKITFWHELNAGVGGRKPVGLLDERD